MQGMPDALETFATPPEERAYIHLKCGQQTTVDGMEFRGLCDPVAGLFEMTARCVACDEQGALEGFVWADTNESLPSYRRRIRASVSVVYLAKRWLLSLVSLLLLPIGLAWAAMRLVPSRPGPAGVISFSVGLLGGLVFAGWYSETRDADFRRYR